MFSFKCIIRVIQPSDLFLFLSLKLKSLYFSDLAKPAHIPACMSDRARRSSTIEATESHLEQAKAKSKEIERSRKISSKLKKIIQKEQADFDQSAVELLALSRGSLGSVIEPSGLYLDTSSSEELGAASLAPEVVRLEPTVHLDTIEETAFVDPCFESCQVPY